MERNLPAVVQRRFNSYNNSGFIVDTHSGFILDHRSAATEKVANIASESMANINPESVANFIPESVSKMPRNTHTVSYLALSERTLRERLPQIPHYRVGTKLLFRKSELDGWMQKHKENSPALDLDRLAEEALKGVIRRTK